MYSKWKKRSVVLTVCTRAPLHLSTGASWLRDARGGLEFHRRHPQRNKMAELHIEGGGLWLESLDAPLRRGRFGSIGSKSDKDG